VLDTGVGTSLSGIRRSEQGGSRKAGVRVLRMDRAQRRETKISARFILVNFRDVTPSDNRQTLVCIDSLESWLRMAKILDRPSPYGADRHPTLKCEPFTCEPL